MQQIDAGRRDGCVILTFTPRQMDTGQIETTSLAALIAVTVLHDSNIPAEDRLIEIIEQSGEIEVLDKDEAFADFGFEEMDISTGTIAPIAANDNTKLTAI
jgi:hypothetical protein